MDDSARRTGSVEEFIAEFAASGGSERSNAQPFVMRLCEVLGLPRPNAAQEDTARDDYVFERRVEFPHSNGIAARARSPRA